MSENLRWYTKALYSMDHVVRGVSSEAWANPSPCEGWTARHVLGHVIAIQRYMLAGLRGEEFDPAAVFTDPHLSAGDDPAGSWAEVRDSMLGALDEPGALQRRIRFFGGETSADDRIGANIGDTTIHAWDIARATGGDERLDPGLVERITGMLAPRVESLRNPTVFGPEVVLGDGADAQARLLAMTGRTP